MSEAEDKLRRLAYLDAMGIQVWQARDAEAEALQTQAEKAVVESTVEATETPQATQELAPTEISTEQPPLNDEIPDFGAPPIEAYSHADIPLEEPSILPVVDEPPPTWEGLKKQVANCTRCELHCQRTQSVFGVGNQQAEWMIIGEAPGADEDRQGEPFVGRAGQLLNLMLQSLGLKREEVYIANIVKCRPPNNRDPKPEEVAACETYLKAQIELIKPKIILSVGRISAHNLLKTNQSVGSLRGRQHSLGDNQIPVVVTYHPAYLLRSPQEKRKAWEDLLFARKLYQDR